MKFFLILLVIGIVLFSPLYAINSFSLSSNPFSSNILLSISNSPYPHHVEPTFAISDNGTLFAGWKDAKGPSSSGVRVSYSKSINSGTTWSSPQDMPLFNSSIQTGQSDPWMIWFNNTLFYFYIEFDLAQPYTSLNLSQVTLAKSTDYGATWQLNRASHNPNFADKETAVISNDGTIYVAYGDVPSSGSNRMRLSYSKDGGKTFNDSLLIDDLSSDTIDQIAPYIDVDNSGKLFVAWLKLTTQTYTGYLVFDSLNMSNFGTDTRITDGNNAKMTQTVSGSGSKWTLPVLRIDNKDRIYVMWSDTAESAGSWDVYLKYSDDYGKTWSEKMRINPSTIGNQWMADMDIDINNNLHVVYYNEQGSSYRPYYQLITNSNNKLTISEAKVVASGDTSSTFSRPGDYLTVRVDENLRTHVVWSDGRNNDMDIFYAHCDCVQNIDFTNSSTTTSNTFIDSSSKTTIAFVDISSIFLVVVVITLIRQKNKQ